MPSVRALQSRFENCDIQEMDETETESAEYNAPPTIQNSNFLTVPQGNLVTTEDPMRTDVKDTDLEELKRMTERLNLATKRPSYVEWRDKYFGTPNIVKTLQRGSLTQLVETRESWSSEREQEINEAITWLRHQLTDMRNEDQALARTLVTLRHDIRQLKLEWSCHEHRMIIEDVQDEYDEEEYIKELSDSPVAIGPLSPLAPSLKKIGLTKMNIERRRYSLC